MQLPSYSTTRTKTMINFQSAKSVFKSLCYVTLVLSFSSLNLRIDNTSKGTIANSNVSLSIGSQANATVTSNFDSLYWGAVVLIRNAKYNKLLNIAEGPIGPNVIWSPETATQNNDNTIVVIKKEGTNIVQFMNRHTRKVMGVNRSGAIESKLEVQTPTYRFDQYQSFYVDYLPNGNVYFSSVAFPERVVHLPYGGSNDFVNYTLYDKTNLAVNLQCQFVVDYQGDGANVEFGSEPAIEIQPPVPEVTYDEPTPEVVYEPQVQTPTPVAPKVVNQYDKLRTGAVLVLRNADQGNMVRITNTANGNPIYTYPASNEVTDEAILVAVNKPGTNIYQFFNRKNGKVLSVDTKGQVGNWLENWNRVPGFNPYQSFYIDTMPNGNMTMSPVAFPNLVANLPEGGRSNKYQHVTLWSKENLENAPNRQFKVDILDYGADTAMPAVQTYYTPTTVTKQQTNAGVVQLVNSNPVNIASIGKPKTPAFGDEVFDLRNEKYLNQIHYYLRANIKSAPVVNDTTIGNLCPEITRAEKSLPGGINWIEHWNSCGKFYMYLNRNALYQLKADANSYSGTFTAATGIITFIDPVFIPLTAIPANTLYKLSNDVGVCIDLGAKSAWVSFEFPKYPFPTLNCNY